MKVIKGNWPEDVIALFKSEATVMSHLRHPHIVTILGFCENPPSIILPVMKKGSLQHIIQAKVGDLSLKLKYLIDAAIGISRVVFPITSFKEWHLFMRII